jgi:hypothetical protein
MRESCTSGSARGARGNSRPYRNRAPASRGALPRPTEIPLLKFRAARRHLSAKLQEWRRPVALERGL